MTENNTATHTFLLVDDDPTFGRIFRMKAKDRNASVVLCISLDNPELLAGQKFSAAILDYDLGDLTGPQLGHLLATVFDNLPVVLISGSDRSAGKTDWPKSVKAFIHKEAGVDAILEAAFAAAKV